jgi:sirohydrochlorin cobaltochelatase
MSNVFLVLLAHGSRDPRWRKPFEALLQRVADAVGAAQVGLAYMEMAEPTLTEVVVAAREAGYRRFRILPLFMAAGAHLAQDVPFQLELLKISYPDLELTLLPPVGEHPEIQAAMARLAEATLMNDILPLA